MGKYREVELCSITEDEVKRFQGFITKGETVLCIKSFFSPPRLYTSLEHTRLQATSDMSISDGRAGDLSA